MASSKFATKVVLRIKGDDAVVAAGKIERKAKNALRSQISSLESKKVDLETLKEDAELALENAIYTDRLIESSETYIYGIKNAQARVDKAVSDLESIEESIEYYENLVETAFDGEED